MIGNSLGVIPMRDIITVISQDHEAKVDDWGIPIYSETTAEYKCHIEYNYKLEAVNIGQGKTEVFTARIYLKSKVILKEEDVVRFLDINDVMVEKKILQVKPMRDFGGRVLYTCLYI